MRNLLLTAFILLTLAACATAGAETPKPSEKHAMMMGAHHMPHIISVKSNAGFDQTLRQLQGAVDQRGFKTFAVIDHAKGAASIGADLNPTTLIIFGNPKGGAPLMLAEQRLGLRLPLKMLVFEDATGDVHVAYPDMAHLFHEYGVSDLTEPLARVEGALAAIAAEASANEER